MATRDVEQRRRANPSSSTREGNVASSESCWKYTSDPNIRCTNLSRRPLQANRPAIDVAFNVYLLNGERDGTLVTLENVSTSKMRLRTWSRAYDNVATFKDLCIVSSETKDQYMDLLICVYSKLHRYALCSDCILVSGVRGVSVTYVHRDTEPSYMASSRGASLDDTQAIRTSFARIQLEEEDGASRACRSFGPECKELSLELPSNESHSNTQRRLETNIRTDVEVNVFGQPVRLKAYQPPSPPNKSSSIDGAFWKKVRRNENKGSPLQRDYDGDAISAESLASPSRQSGGESQYNLPSTSAQDDCLPTKRSLGATAALSKQAKHYLPELQQKQQLTTQQNFESQGNPQQHQRLNLPPPADESDTMVSILDAIDQIWDTQNERNVVAESPYPSSSATQHWHPLVVRGLDIATRKDSEEMRQRRSQARSRLAQLMELMNTLPEIIKTSRPPASED